MCWVFLHKYTVKFNSTTFNAVSYNLTFWEKNPTCSWLKISDLVMKKWTEEGLKLTSAVEIWPSTYLLEDISSNEHIGSNNKNAASLTFSVWSCCIVNTTSQNEFKHACKDLSLQTINMVARVTLQSKTETYLPVLQKNNYVTDGCLHPLQLKSIKSLSKSNYWRWHTFGT